MFSLIQNEQVHLLLEWKIKFDEEVKNERVHRLIELNDQLAKQYASSFEDEVLEVIPEEKYKLDPDSGLYEGYSDNYLKVVFPADESMVGKIVRVKIVKAGYPYNEGQFVRVFEEASTTCLKFNKSCTTLF